MMAAILFLGSGWIGRLVVSDGWRHGAAQATVCPFSWPWSSPGEGRSLISLREEQRNHAWLSCTTPFRLRDASTCPSSPSGHLCALHRRLRRFRSSAYLALL